MISFLTGIALAVSLGPNALDTTARQPQMAVNGSVVALTFGAGKQILFSISKDSGRNFSVPTKVADADILPLGRHRGPRIAFAKGTIVISAVTGRMVAEGPHAHGLPSDGNLVVWRSTDGGANWSAGVRVNDVPGAATEGLHALAGDANGNVFAAWLDHRGAHGAKLYGARSSDSGATWSNNVLIYDSPAGSICECCHPSIAMDPTGQILVMWRNWLAGSRDMYLTRSSDGLTFSKAEKLGKGTWPLNACPMDGGGIAASQDRVVTAWRRDREIFLAQPGETEVSIGEGVDVSVALSAKAAYAVWSTPTGIRALLPGQKGSVALAPKGTFPNVVVLSDGGALAAWEEDGKIQVQPIP